MSAVLKADQLLQYKRGNSEKLNRVSISFCGRREILLHANKKLLCNKIVKYRNLCDQKLQCLIVSKTFEQISLMCNYD